MKMIIEVPDDALARIVMQQANNGDVCSLIDAVKDGTILPSNIYIDELVTFAKKKSAENA